MVNLKGNISCKMLVLMDFSAASYSALRYAISLAKLGLGSIQVIHLADPAQFIKSDNQAVALKEISSETEKIENQLAAISEIILADGLPFKYQYSFGNRLQELQAHLAKNCPDLVIIGKKKDKPKSPGKVSSYLLDKYAGTLLIVDGPNEFLATTSISLGCNTRTFLQCDPQIVIHLKSLSQAPLTFVNVRNAIEPEAEIDLSRPQMSFQDKNFKVERLVSPSVSQGLLAYIKEKKVSLICLGRGRQKTIFYKLFFRQKAILHTVYREVSIPILIMGADH